MPRVPDPPPFEIRRSAIQGRGAFATRAIRAGSRVAEYTGEHISQEEGDRRYAEDGMARHHTFLFTLDDDVLIDGGRGGNDSRFLNHSCDPNCEAVIEGDRIFFHALRAIRPGDELTFDYKYERTDAHTEEDERFYACRCGSPKCRGSILAPKPKPRRAASTGGTKRAAKGAAKQAAAKKGAAKKGAAKTGAAKKAARRPAAKSR